MVTATIVNTIRQKYQLLKPELDERSRRLWAATEAMMLGHGGVRAVARATGISESSIRFGLDQLKEDKPAEEQTPRRIHQPGGGRKPLTEEDPALWEALEALVDPDSRGDPMSPLRWTSKSTRNPAEELTRQGHPVSHRKVGQLLKDLGLQLAIDSEDQRGLLPS